MSIPGSNLLNQALRAIKPTTVDYLRYNERKLDARRQYVDFYDVATPIKASVQAVKRTRYKDLGLDLQKNYINIWASENLIDIGRDYSGDIFVHDQKAYKLNENTNWTTMDGWASATAVEIGRYAALLADGTINTVDTP